MPHKCPLYPAILQLVDADFSREGPIRLVEDILRRHFNVAL
jgi:hypothetical protein